LLTIARVALIVIVLVMAAIVATDLVMELFAKHLR